MHIIETMPPTNFADIHSRNEMTLHGHKGNELYKTQWEPHFFLYFRNFGIELGFIQNQMKKRS